MTSFIGDIYGTEEPTEIGFWAADYVRILKVIYPNLVVHVYLL